MTQKEILEYNKRCAEFLFPNAKEEYESGKIEVTHDIFKKVMLVFEHFHMMKFHSDWNWIMEVVETIEKLSYATSISHKYCISNYGCNLCEIDYERNALLSFEDKEEPIVEELTKTKKEAVVKAINQFLIWYGTNK